MYQIANANGVTLADGDTIDIELEEETYRRWVEGWISANQNLSLLLQVYGSDWITVETGAIVSGRLSGSRIRLPGADIGSGSPIAPAARPPLAMRSTNAERSECLSQQTQHS